MNTRSDYDATIDSARKILNSDASSIADCESAKSSLDRVLAEIDADLEERRAHRKAIMASTGSAAELEKAIKKHDEASSALQLKSEIAASTAAKLDATLGQRFPSGHLPIEDSGNAESAGNQVGLYVTVSRRGDPNKVH
jgi:hypothetical protein